MEKVFKLTTESVKKVKANFKSSDFESRVKPLYLDKNISNFELSSNGLEVLDGFYEIPSFDLKSDKTGKYDFHNSKIIYEAFKFLSPEEADDSRLWVYLTHSLCFDYSRTRWLSSNSSNEVFERRLLYEGDGRGSRTRNAISRLWWTAYLTYNNDEPGNEWNLTEAIFEIQDLQVGLLERNMGSYKNVLTGFLKFYLLNKGVMKSTVIQAMIKDLNNLGGVYFLPILDADSLDKILKKLLTKHT
jgi:hypothetical protein